VVSKKNVTITIKDAIFIKLLGCWSYAIIGTP
jgi:hypothetical protein